MNISKVMNNGKHTTQLNDDEFLQFAENSTMGVLIIQRGYIKYFNKKFQEIFGYPQDEISSWTKFENLKIIHSNDILKFKIL
ncbi:MAG: PAS domain S-box protein [Candidatus Odinarchaeota archaeon]